MQRLVRVGLTLLVVLLALLAGWWLWSFYMLSPWTRDARVRADVVTIAPDVSGWVVQLQVADNQQVKAGDLRALTVVADSESQFLPGVPTLKSTGFTASDMTSRFALSA